MMVDFAQKSNFGKPHALLGEIVKISTAAGGVFAHDSDERSLLEYRQRLDALPVSGAGASRIRLRDVGSCQTLADRPPGGLIR